MNRCQLGGPKRARDGAPAGGLAWTLACLGISCTVCPEGGESGVSMRLEDPSVASGDFFGHPWPSDARRRANGTLRLADFPNPTGSSTLQDYLGAFEAGTRAFSTTAPIYIAFSGPIDPESLPSDPLRALDDGASLALVDIDPSSPERGRRFPLEHRYEDDSTLYLPVYHLIVRTPHGVPLRGDTTYALMGTKAIHDAAGRPVIQGRALGSALRDACLDRVPRGLADLFAPLRSFLRDAAGMNERAERDIVAATVFTTQGAVREMRAIAGVARREPPPLVEGLTLRERRDHVLLVEGTIDLPGFQDGDIPYRSLGDGGAIALDGDGVPQVTHHERARVAFAIPRVSRDRGLPSGGWPIVVYAHGTGGDYSAAFDPRVADVLGESGIAVVGYDQTLHGPRDPTRSDPYLTFFNLFNPVAARDNIRQGAADVIAMVNLIAGGFSIPADVTGEESVHFDPSRVGFLGHSHGSLTGAAFLASDPRARAFTFSGLGAILTITLLERKDFVDFKALLESLFLFPPGEALDELHPILALVQTFIEPADPISYAGSYLLDPPEGARRDVLVVEGLRDFASPARGQEAFAAAARIPVILPAHRVPRASELLGPEPIPPPASENASAPAGRVTCGLIQYPEETHYPLFENDDANARFEEFFRSALIDGRARIIPAFDPP